MIKNNTLFNYLTSGFFIFFSSSVFSQILINSFHPEKNDFTLALSYTSKKSDSFYRGSETILSNPASFENISSNIYSLYSEYSISNSLSVVLNVPYITSENENEVLDPVKGVSKIEGFQDVSLFFKSKIIEKNYVNSSKLSLSASGGIDIPTGYDEGGILALGNGATSFYGFGLLQYVFPINIFSELTAGYTLKTNSTFDVPNAMLYRLKLGYFSESLYFHFSYTFQYSTSGIDIGSKEYMQTGRGFLATAETKVDSQNLRINLFVPLFKNKIGLTVGFSEVIAGRNKANDTGLSFGLVYNFSTQKRNTVFIVPF